MLSRLDAAVGDGDHGTTILRTMEAVAKAIADNPGTDLKELLAKIAWAVMDCDGGSTGPLLGSLFMGMSDAVAGKTELDCAAVVAMFEGGIRKLAKQSRAVVGDKTMMDAFLPALDAMQAAAPSGGIRTALQQAAAAAAAGAEATKAFPRQIRPRPQPRRPRHRPCRSRRRLRRRCSSKASARRFETLTRSSPLTSPNQAIPTPWQNKTTTRMPPTTASASPSNNTPSSSRASNTPTGA